MILNVSDAGTPNARMGASWFGITDNTNATKDAINNYNILLDQLTDYKNQISGLSEETNAFDAVNRKLQDTQNKLSAATKTGNDNLNLYLQGLNSAKGSVKDYNAGLVTSRIKTIALTAATTALNAVISWGLSLAISALTTIITEWWQSVAHADEVLQETIGTGKEASKTIQDLVSNFAKTKNDTNEIKDKFIQLSKGVDAFGKNVSLTDEQYKEYLELNNKLAEIFPDIKTGIDEQGNAILSLAHNTDTLTASIEALIDAEKREAALELNDNFESAFTGYESQEKKYKGEIQDLKNKISTLTEFVNYNPSSTENPEANNPLTFWSRWTSKLLGVEDNEKIGYMDFVQDVTNWKSNNYVNSDGYMLLSDFKEFLSQGGFNDEEIKSLLSEASIPHDAAPLTQIHFDNVLERLSLQIGNQVAGYTKQLKQYEREIKTNWTNFTKNIIAWMQVDSIDYSMFGEKGQNLINNMVLSLDPSKIKDAGYEGSDGVKEYVQMYILDPLSEYSDEVNEAAIEMTSLEEKFSKGLITEDLFIEKYTKVFDSLKGNEEASKLLVTSFNALGYEGDDLSSVLTEMANAVIGGKVALTELNEAIDVSHLSEIADAISAASSAFKDFNDNGYVSFSNLEALKEKFSDVEGIDNYITKLASASLSSSELNDVLNSLIVAQIQSKFSTQELANANVDLIANMLKSNGVANASVVAAQMINDAKTQLILTTELNKAKTIEELEANLTAIGVAEEYITVAKELFGLKDILNDLDYDSSESVKNFIAEAKAAGIAAEALIEFEKISTLLDQKEYWEQVVSEYESGSKRYSSSQYKRAKEIIEGVNRQIENLSSSISFDFSNFDLNFDIPEIDLSGYEDVATKISNAYQEEREILDYNHEMGFISTKEYYNKLAALNDKYYKNSAEHQSEYLDNIVELHDMWNEMYEEDKEQLDYQHEMGILSDEQYYAKLLSLSSAYYKGRGGYEKEWQDAQIELRQLQQQILDDTLADYDEFLSRHEDLMIYSAKTEKDITKKKLLAIEDAYRKGTLTQKEYLEKWNEIMSDDFSKTQDSFERAFNYMSAYIDEKLDALDEQNNKLEEQKELEEALAELEKAKMQRNKRMYVDGVGFVWVADQEAIKTAQESYNELLNNKKLEEQKQYWEDLKQSLEDILTIQEGNEDRDITESLFGKNWQTNLENGVNFISNIASKYATALGATQADILIKNGDQSSIVSQMKLNSSSWQGAGASERAYLAAQNEALGKALGWVKKNGTWYDKSGKRMYASGGVADFTGTAMLHGSKTSSEVIFSASDAAKLYEYVHTTPDLVQHLYRRIFDNTEASKAVTGGQNIVVDMGGIHVHGNADRDTVTEMSNVFDRKMNDLVSSLRNQSIQRAYKR